MAGAKETPRQKLISLMYLVFITMLALNVSKEVLDGFGQMYEKISDANERVDESNINIFENIKVNAEEKGGKWVGHLRTATEIKEESDDNANIIWGITNDESYSGKFKISVISTGIDSETFIKRSNEKLEIKKVESNISENYKENDKSLDSPKFLVELENPKLTESFSFEQLNHEKKIKELEEKANEFKDDEEKTKTFSFFEKIFGNKKNNKIVKNETNNEKTLSVFDQEIDANNKQQEIKENSLFDNPGDNDSSLNNLEEVGKSPKNKTEEELGRNSDEELLQIPAFLRRQAN